jgi:hypothetical protein
MWTARASLAGLMFVLLAPACSGRPSRGAANAAAARTGDEPAVAAALRFVADDAPTALADAKRRGVPVFVEAWAPW